MYFLEPDILSISFGHVTMECTQRWIDCCVFVCMPVLFSLSFFFSVSVSRSFRLTRFSLHSITAAHICIAYTHKHKQKYTHTRMEQQFVGWKTIHVNTLGMLFVYRNYLPTQTISYWRNVISRWIVLTFKHFVIRQIATSVENNLHHCTHRNIVSSLSFMLFRNIIWTKNKKTFSLMEKKCI